MTLFVKGCCALDVVTEVSAANVEDRIGVTRSSDERKRLKAAAATASCPPPYKKMPSVHVSEKLKGAAQFCGRKENL